MDRLVWGRLHPAKTDPPSGREIHVVGYLDSGRVTWPYLRTCLSVRCNDLWTYGRDAFS